MSQLATTSPRLMQHTPMGEKQMTLAEFAKLVRAREAELAPGNETPLLTHLHREMEDAVGPAWRAAFDAADGIAFDDRAHAYKWGTRAYDLWAADLKRAPADQYEDILDLFVAVDS